MTTGLGRPRSLAAGPDAFDLPRELRRRAGWGWPSDGGHRGVVRAGSRHRLEDLPQRGGGGGRDLPLATIDGPGRITHLWITTHVDNWRTLVLRAYWDGADEPAVEVPYGDFFCSGWGRFAQVNSQPIAANPNGGFNSYWPMPFRSGARLTIENTSDQPVTVYYQVTYELGEDHADDGYLHAQWRRSNPLESHVPHTILDGIEGAGHYVGTYLAWGVNSNGWWGEGEIKFFLDDDVDYPTICGTGTEDYFGGAWNFDVPGQGYVEFSTPVPRHAAGDPPGRALRRAAAVRPLPVPRAGPDPLHRPPRRHHPGARLAQSAPLPAAAGRHRLHGVLLPGPPGRPASGAADGRRDGDPVPGSGRQAPLETRSAQPKSSPACRPPPTRPRRSWPARLPWSRLPGRGSSASTLQRRSPRSGSRRPGGVQPAAQPVAQSFLGRRRAGA